MYGGKQIHSQQMAELKVKTAAEQAAAEAEKRQKQAAERRTASFAAQLNNEAGGVYDKAGSAYGGW